MELILLVFFINSGYFDSFVLTLDNGEKIAFFDFIKPYSSILLILGFILFFSGFIFAFNEDFGIFSYDNDSDSFPSSTYPISESPITFEKAKEIKRDNLVFYQCPVCSAPLSFESGNVTECKYCKTRVEKR